MLYQFPSCAAGEVDGPERDDPTRALSDRSVMSSNAEPTECIGCLAHSVDLILDFGRQPPSNRFFRPDEPQSECHSLVLGCCGVCGLVQLIQPMAPDMVRSHHAWISYNEPEGHLDRMTDDLIGLCGLGEGARILGLSYKDDTTLARFNRRGLALTYRLDPSSDLGIEDPLVGLEGIQKSMTAERAAWLADRHGQADLLLVRHVLEHAHAPLQFLGALTSLVKPTGFLVFEMPGSAKFLAACDYSFLWEEHIAYFTGRTIRQMMLQGNLDPWMIRSYDYPLEDSLVAVVRPVRAGSAPVAPTPPDQVAAEVERAAAFGRRFAATRERLHGELQRLQGDGKRVAIFGAGHLAVKFLNLFGLKDLVYCVIDDHPDKLGLCMPGSGLRVRPSSVLLEDNIDLCLLSLNPESEKRVIAAKHDYVSRGGRFRSIFALSPIAFEGA